MFKEKNVIIGIITATVIIFVLNVYFISLIFWDPSPIITGKTKTKPQTVNIKQAIETINILSIRKPLNIIGITPVSSSSAGPGQESKKFILKILNGTSVPGIASQIKDSLNNFTYLSTIELGNIDSTSSTELKFKKSIPANIVEEILSKIGSQVKNPQKGEQPEKDSTDILLIIGTQ